jgi:DNA helicase-2/ATP-dependent DNA helicase PcrA
VTMLKAWRLERAKREARPAYTILHDSTLEAIASSGARSLGELARIKGIGPAKLDSFGDEILAVLDAAGDG